VKRRVLWVDEDERIWAPERRLLTGLGFEVVPVGDATTAYGMVLAGQLDGVSLIILDVMLLQGDDESIFSDATTNHGLNTGLVLARRITEHVGGIAGRMLFFTRATEESHVALIRSTAKELGLHYLPKSPKTQGRHFIAWLKQNGFIGSA
jgi:DNA-binding response OmpR family regulator